MVEFIEAVETEPQAHASRLMRVILKYNGEDLDAPWYVDQRIAANSLELVGD
jgi:hypothetical protein